MILYAKEEGQINLVLWQGQLLGQLGETPQKDMEIPAEETNDLLSYWYETSICGGSAIVLQHLLWKQMRKISQYLLQQC